MMGDSLSQGLHQNFFSNVHERKRFAQSKDLWDILMLLSEQYPEICKTLATERILLSKDLIRVSSATRNAIIDCLPAGKTADQIFLILKNFAVEDQSLVAHESEEVLEELSASLTAASGASKLSLARSMRSFYPVTGNPLSRKAASRLSNRAPKSGIDVEEEEDALSSEDLRDIDAMVERQEEIRSKTGGNFFTFDDTLSEDSDFEIDDFDTTMEIYMSDAPGDAMKESSAEVAGFSSKIVKLKSKALPRTSSMREESINFGSDYHLDLAAEDHDLGRDVVLKRPKNKVASV
jgi:hypothetical protein